VRKLPHAQYSERSTNPRFTGFDACNVTSQSDVRSRYGLSQAQQLDGGNIFQLTPPGSGGNWSFASIHDYMDAYPATNLTIGENGILYGDIYGDQDFNAGYVFELAHTKHGKNWKYTTLVDFNQMSYGANPTGVLASGGNLYTSMTDGGSAPGNIDLIVP